MLDLDLSGFTGTDHYYRWSSLFRNCLLTDGTHYLAETAGAYWLMDAIASHQPKLRRHQDERLRENLTTHRKPPCPRLEAEGRGKATAFPFRAGHACQTHYRGVNYRPDAMLAKSSRNYLRSHAMATASNDPSHYLRVAQRHLQRVKDATDEPDWSDLGTYGLYCLEALVRAATLKDGGTPNTSHWGKVNQAKDLLKTHGLPDIEDLLRDLNDMRKAIAYGDIQFDESEYDAKDISTQIEEYFNDVSDFCK